MYEDLFEYLVSEVSDEDLQKGDRVIVRSNEPEPLMLGEYLGDQTFGKSGSLIPIVRSEKDGKDYMAMGIIKKFSEELMDKLEGMDPKEQWNFLCHPWTRKE
jgi:hypothetical protein